MSSKVRALDIFCGGGGSSFGAQGAGAEIACGIDMWDVATSTFQHNFPSSKIHTSRLEDIHIPRLRKEIGDIDLLLASPECTNHTCAKGSAPRSEESRATAMQTLRFARAFKPRWIVMENVIHMRPWSRYEELKRELRALKYHVSEAVLDASDFGVPQKRRRLFVICDRLAPPKPVRTKTNLGTRSVRDILDPPGTWKTSPLFEPKRSTATLERAERGFASLGKRTPFLLVYYGSDGSGGWQPLDRPLRTVTTVDRFALIEPSNKGHQMRMLQVPELSRAMGFTSDYTLPLGTRRERVRLLGNGVCPPVMTRIVSALAESL